MIDTHITVLTLLSLIGVEYYKHTLERQLHVCATGFNNTKTTLECCTQLQSGQSNSKVSWQTRQNP